MNTRGPSASLAARIRSASASGLADEYASGRAFCRRSMWGMTSLGRRSGQWPAGTAWSPIRGDVGPGAVDVAGNQAGVPPVYCLWPGIAFHGPASVAWAGDRGAGTRADDPGPVSYTHLRAHETGRNLVC